MVAEYTKFVMESATYVRATGAAGSELALYPRAGGVHYVQAVQNAISVAFSLGNIVSGELITLEAFA